jgi:hypothetical protein
LVGDEEEEEEGEGEGEGRKKKEDRPITAAGVKRKCTSSVSHTSELVCVLEELTPTPTPAFLPPPSSRREEVEENLRRTRTVSLAVPD